VLDGERGEILFGDGVRGARLPRGFRHVIARRYQVGGGIGGRVKAGASFDLVSPAPFIGDVTNPFAASGGRNVEQRAETLRRGPEEIRARGRAVTPADYVLLVQQVPGADVARVHTIPGRDIRFPGAAVAGTVSVLLVSSDRGASPPIPDAGTIEQVAAWLTSNVAPAGIQVVAGAPRFVSIGVRASVVLRGGADAGTTIALALQNLDDFLHPLRGGEDRDGWPFGGAVRYQALVRMLLDRTPGLVAVSRLNLVVDGTTRPHCLDFPLPSGALIWPVGHEVVPVTEEPRP
jgi:predicted phage baseplate assembly protein